MSRVEVLRRNRESYAVKLQEFLSISSKQPQAYCIFFEGVDSKYYAHRIELLRPDLRWHGINSGGKNNALKLYHVLVDNPLHASLKYLFFIDRDFDEVHELPQDHRVYVTPGYSIENLYVNTSTFVRVLLHEFGVKEFDDTDNSFEKCLRAFEKALVTFVDSVAELNGWIMLQRRHEKANPGTVKMNLNSINLGKMIHIQLDSCCGSYLLEEIEKVTGASLKISKSQALAAISNIEVSERPIRFRGKFQAHFFRVYMSRLVSDANSSSPVLFSNKRSVHFACSDKNFISELSQYADTPSCLRLFLQSIVSVPTDDGSRTM